VPGVQRDRLYEDEAVRLLRSGRRVRSMPRPWHRTCVAPHHGFAPRIRPSQQTSNLRSHAMSTTQNVDVCLLYKREPWSGKNVVRGIRTTF